MPEPIAVAQEGEQPLGLRVSVILVAYNQAVALRRALAALERSTDRERFEILVVDCGSSDESAQMDTEFLSINLLRLPHHLGATRAMNIGTRTAKADLLLYLSPNVEVGPKVVTALADRLEPESELAAVSPLLTDPNGATIPQIRRIPDRAVLSAAASGASIPATTQEGQDELAIEYPSLDALMIRKVFVRGMNYFDERHYGHYWADLDMAMQMKRAGKKTLLVPWVQAVYHAAADPLENDSLAKADRLSGVAAFIGKYEGFMPGLMFRLTAALRALARFNFGQFSSALGGTKLDGSQAG
jgi:GT2 family glycosyltransferase